MQRNFYVNKKLAADEESFNVQPWRWRHILLNKEIQFRELFTEFRDRICRGRRPSDRRWPSKANCIRRARLEIDTSTLGRRKRIRRCRASTPLTNLPLCVVDRLLLPSLIFFDHECSQFFEDGIFSTC